MSIVGRVGSRRPRARLGLLLLYGLLTLGALTMLYPFLLMLGTSFTSATDQNDNRIFPAFWRDDSKLYAKYLDDKYSGSVSMIASTRSGEVSSRESLVAYERLLLSLEPSEFLAGFRTPSSSSTSRLTLLYQVWLRTRFGSIDALNRAYTEENLAFQSVTPPAELIDRPNWKPLPGLKQEEWALFKRGLPTEYRLPIRAERAWQEYLRIRFENRIGRVPPAVRMGASTFDTIRLGTARLDPAFQKAFGDVISRSIEQKWSRISTAPLPIEAAERAFVEAHKAVLRREMSGRNYRFVLDYVLLNGRAIWNTALFCILTILTQLTVNPLAAYALSRYPMRATGKILLFLLATMAFPAEVTMIPGFLLLKDLGLLNTFAALVLPGIASGFMIFLLKGFFDSLPPELFESGQIDGAREFTMLAKIALPLSKPVLGYMALSAFVGAYGAFMYAFLVAQDQRMWTLMVWIYQLQTGAPKSVMMAAITVAAIPTLIVFLAAQRVIMRGMIVPGEK